VVTFNFEEFKEIFLFLLIHKSKQAQLLQLTRNLRLQRILVFNLLFCAVLVQGHLIRGLIPRLPELFYVHFAEPFFLGVTFVLAH